MLRLKQANFVRQGLNEIHPDRMFVSRLVYMLWFGGDCRVFFLLVDGVSESGSVQC